MEVEVRESFCQLLGSVVSLGQLVFVRVKEDVGGVGY